MGDARLDKAFFSLTSRGPGGCWLATPLPMPYYWPRREFRADCVLISGPLLLLQTLRKILFFVSHAVGPVRRPTRPYRYPGYTPSLVMNRMS